MNEEKILPDLSAIEGRGEPSMLSGATGGGKTTLVNSAILSGNVQNVVALRQANGKGTIATTKITLTNYNQVPKDKVVITGRLPDVNKQDLIMSDDNNFMIDILYYSIKAYNDAIDNKTLNEKTVYEESMMENLLDSVGLEKDNSTLAFKIGSLYVNQVAQIRKVLEKFDIDILNKIYVESKTVNGNKKSKDLFKEKFLLASESIDNLKDTINEFWDTLQKILNDDKDTLYDEIVKFNKNKGYKCEKSDDCKFTLVVDDDDIQIDKRYPRTIEDNIVYQILNSEKSTKEFYIRDFRLTVYTDFESLGLDVEFYKVAEQKTDDGKINPIYCTQLIDTMGMFHKVGAKIEDEKSRLIDILKAEHCTNIIFVMKSNIDGLTKNGILGLLEFLRNNTKGIQIYIVYTHFDEYILQYMRKKSNPFERNNVDEKTNVVEKAFNSLEEDYKILIDDVSIGNKKSLIKIVGFYPVGMYTNDNTIDDQIDAHGYNYRNGIKKILLDISKKNNYKKYKIYNIPDNPVVANVDTTIDYPIKTLYENLVYNKEICCTPDCNVHWNTAKATIGNWRDYGNKFISEAQGLRTGYSKIETYFVERIRDFVSSNVVKHIDVADGDWHSDSTSVGHPGFNLELIDYMSNNLGRKVAINICKKLYSESQFYYYCNYLLRDILNSCQYKYFSYPSIKINNELKECIDASLMECFNEFINYKCILTY